MIFRNYRENMHLLVFHRITQIVSKFNRQTLNTTRQTFVFKQKYTTRIIYKIIKREKCTTLCNLRNEYDVHNESNYKYDVKTIVQIYVRVSFIIL